MRNEHRNGRPSTNAQLQIKSTLRRYFEDGMSAYFTSENTGINIKTVCKYFNEWSEEIELAESSSFFERQKRDRIQIINSYDSQIHEARKLLAQINLEIDTSIKENKKIPRYLIPHKISLLKFISYLIDKKATLTMIPPMGEALKKTVAEMIKENGKTG